MTNALEHSIDLKEVLLSTLREGCIGESTSAMVAREEAARCIDPVVKGALERIVREETRHAQLAWSTLKWALSQDAKLHAVLHDEIAKLSQTATSVTIPDGGPLATYGCLNAETKSGIVMRTITEVVIPCPNELLSDGRSTKLEASLAAQL